MAEVDFDNPLFDKDDVAYDPADDITDPAIDDIIGDTTPLIPPGINAGTGIGDASGVGTREWSLQHSVLRSRIDDIYDTWRRKGFVPQTGRDYNIFEYGPDNTLRLKARPDLAIVNPNTKAPYALSTIARQEGGREAVRNELGFSDWGYKSRPEVTHKDATALNKTYKALSDVENGLNDNTELKTIVEGASDASGALQELETSLSNDPPLTLREIQGLDKALQTIRGELTNNLAKLSELDNNIAYEKDKLKTRGISEDDKSRIAKRMRGLQDERASRLEAAASNREALRSQVNRIRETIRRILHEDTTLAERIRTLFREQGITIASILTALGMAISALVFALTGSGGGASPTPDPPQPPGKGGVKEWVKKTLQSLGRALAKLAGKAAAALPGIIGSIVSWLLSLLAKTAGWLAENLWAVVLAVGSLLFVAAREWLLPKNPKSE